MSMCVMTPSHRCLDKLPPPLPSILWSWLIGKKERDFAMRREGAGESVVCVCERQRERERESERERERDRQRERDGAMRYEFARERAVCVCERERECVCVYINPDTHFCILAHQI